MIEESLTRAIAVFDVAELAAARRLGEEHGVELESVSERGLEPLSTVTVILVGAAVGIHAFQHAVERMRGGQVIDLRPGARRPFRRTADLEYGTVVILAQDGTATVQVTSDRPADVVGALVAALPALLNGSGKSVEKAAAVMRSAFGDDVAVTTGTGEAE